MAKINLKIIFLFCAGFLLVGKSNIKAKCFPEGCNISKNHALKYEKKNLNTLNDKEFLSLKSTENHHSSVKNNNLNKIFGENSIKIQNIFNNLLLANNADLTDYNSEDFSFQIESNSKYFEGDIFYAEGNVEVSLPNGILTVDKISYDKSRKLFKAYNNLRFQKGYQFFKADYLEYDFLKNKGYVKNIFGVLDFKTINSDLDMTKKIIKNNSCEKNFLDLNEMPTEVQLLGSTNERYKNSVALNKLKFNLGSITNWRFKSKRIDLEKNKWTADLIDFTNDPYNTPQIILRSRNFVGEILDNETKLTSKSTSLNFEDKLSIPLIGKRTIGSSDSGNLRWGAGYQSDEKDGFYLFRNFDPIIFKDNFSLDLQPYFLLQRAIEGSSNSFRKKHSSVVSDNFKKDINFYDYFGLNARLNSKFDKWQFNINVDSKTLNPDNFYDAFSGDLNFLRNLYSIQNGRRLSEGPNCLSKFEKNNHIESYSVDLGFYSSFDKGDVYLSYGTKLIGNYKFIQENFNKDYSIVFDLGEYKGRSLNDTYELKNASRYGISSSFTHKYKISNLNKISKVYSDEYKYSPSIVDNGIFLNAKLGLGFFEYSNGQSQSLASFMVGPSYTYGNLKKNFLDYTKISIFPEFILKNGQSPFTFDNFNNDSRIRFDLRQQLFGPIILSYQGNYNINTDSDNYGNFENKIISLELSRRSYSAALSYSEDDKSIFLGFEIFNFGDSEFQREF